MYERTLGMARENIYDDRVTRYEKLREESRREARRKKKCLMCFRREGNKVCG